MSMINPWPVKLFVIDDFSRGSFSIESANYGAPPWPNPLVKITEVGNATIGGTRETWVQKGIDNDPAIAKLQDGRLSYLLDNDECVGGLIYSNFDKIDLSNSRGIAFDIFYKKGGGQEESAALAGVTLYDSKNKSAKGHISFGTGLSGRIGASGTYTLKLDKQIRDSIDLTTINQINIDFDTASNYAGWFSIDSIYAISPSLKPAPHSSSE